MFIKYRPKRKCKITLFAPVGWTTFWPLKIIDENHSCFDKTNGYEHVDLYIPCEFWWRFTRRKDLYPAWSCDERFFLKYRWQIDFSCGWKYFQNAQSHLSPFQKLVLQWEFFVPWVDSKIVTVSLIISTWYSLKGFKSYLLAPFNNTFPMQNFSENQLKPNFKPDLS